MFDVNGTLIDDIMVVYLAVVAVFKRYKTKPPTLLEMRSAEHIDHEWYRRQGFPKSVTDQEIIDAFNEAAPKYFHLRKLRKDAILVLQKCRKNQMNVVAVSALNTQLLGRVMEDMNLEPHFDAIYGSAGSKHATFLETMKRFGIPPEESFYVGDSVIDVKSSKLAGITAIAFLNGYSLPNLLLAQNPDFVVKSLSDLLKILKERGRE